MKNAARVSFLAGCMIWLATWVSVPAQAEVYSIGILPVQDESGAQVPPELLLKVGQDFKQKLTLAYQDILARPVAGVSESASLDVGQLAAIGKQQGVQYVLRSGVLGLLSDKQGRELKCDVGLYAELISSEGGAITSLRANGTGLEANPPIDDVRSWDTYDFRTASFSRSALGQALNMAIDQLVQQVHQAVVPSAQEMTEAVPAEGEPQPPVDEQAATAYETDQELQQLIAQAESLVASGAADGTDISSLQQGLDSLLASLNRKISLMEQGQDTSEVDQEIDQRKTELQNVIGASTQEALTQPPPEVPQPGSGEPTGGISTLNQLLSEALNCLLKIQEISTAMQNFGQGPPSMPADGDWAAAPMDEPTSDVSGVVIDDTGNPVEGATVMDPQSGASSITDSSGSYVIPNIPSRRFATMKVFKAGKQLSSGNIRLQPGRMAFADWRVGTGGTAMKTAGIKILPANVILASKAGSVTTRSGTIKGVVNDDQGKPVTRALVIVKGLGVARTDSQGRYMFVNVPQGDYQIMIRKGGATVQTERVRVVARKVVENRTLYKSKAFAASALTRQAVLVRGAGATLAGKVTNNYRQPLPGAKVTVIYSGGAMSVFTNAMGTYEFKNLKQGLYRLLANKAGYKEAGGSVALKGTQREVRDFMLEKSSAEIQKVLSVMPSTPSRGTRAAIRSPGDRAVVMTKGHLYGVVRDARSNKPIDGATVQMYGQRIVRTDRQGTFSIRDVPPSTYRVLVSHRDYRNEDKTVTIRANYTSKEYFSLKEKEGQDIRPATTPLLLRPSAIQGQVRGIITDSKTGKPVDQATVSLANRKTQTGSSGEYSFQNIPAGSYTMTIEKTNYQDGSRRVTVRAGKTTNSDFRLVPKVSVQIKRRIFPSVSPR